MIDSSMFTFNSTNLLTNLSEFTGAPLPTMVDMDPSALLRSSVQIPITLLAVVVTGLSYSYIKLHRRRFALPPGPKPLPIVGNLFDMPKKEQWKTYKQWSDQYDSDLIHVNVFGTDIIVVNSAFAADDLFKKRSAFYSSRPSMPMIRDLIGFDWHFAFMPHDGPWKEHRRLFGQVHSPQHAIDTRPQQIQWTQTYLLNLLQDPSNFFDHIQHMNSGLVLEDTYGLQVQPSGKPDPFINAATESIGALGAAGIYGSYLVDYLPILKYVPSWFPYADFKRAAKNWRVSSQIAATVPFNLVKTAMAEGTAVPCVTTKLLKKLSGSDPHGEEIVRHIGSSMFAQGSAADVSAMRTFFLAMVLYPQVQAKAQEEIDSVVHGRLPDFSDRDSLPYINAIITEVLRWNPIVPLAFPHELEVDDMYHGYHLPAGSVIVPNTWAILQDPSTYRNPTVFDPSRFLTKDGKIDPTKNIDAAWGYGRRICPGRNFAMSSLYISIATTLAAFNIKKAVDEDGFHIKPSAEYTAGLLRYAKPFKCDIVPRSAETEIMINAMAGN